jgi:hypothetical protein
MVAGSARPRCRLGPRATRATAARASCAGYRQNSPIVKLITIPYPSCRVIRRWSDTGQRAIRHSGAVVSAGPAAISAIRASRLG